MKVEQPLALALALLLAAPAAGVRALEAIAHAPGAAAGGSGAHVLRLVDPQGDTWSFTDVSGYVPEVKPQADVLRAAVTHAPYAVGVRLAFDDLRRRGTMWYHVEIRTSGATRWYVVEAKRADYAGTAYQDVDGEWVRVPRLRHHIDYVADTMTFRVPRALLGDPSWVRVRVRSELGVPDGTFFTDNPVNTGPRPAFTVRVMAPPGAPGSWPTPSSRRIP
jgi:hypothetical protein